MFKTTLVKSIKYLLISINKVKKIDIDDDKYKSIKKIRNEIVEIYLNPDLKFCLSIKKFKVLAL